MSGFQNRLTFKFGQVIQRYVRFSALKHRDFVGIVKRELRTWNSTKNRIFEKIFIVFWK